LYQVRAKPDKDVDKTSLSRPVFVIGPPFAQWAAQKLLYSRIQELFIPEHGGVVGQVTFDVEVVLPAEHVDYLISQGGTKLKDVAELSVSHIVGVYSLHLLSSGFFYFFLSIFIFFFPF
jgi:hypothetical protein